MHVHDREDAKELKAMQATREELLKIAHKSKKRVGDSSEVLER